MWALVVRFDLRDENAATGFDGLVAELVPRIAEHEPGTLVYAVHSVEGEPLSRVFYELYASREAFDDHERQEHTKAFLAAREQYVADLRVEFLTSPTGKGLQP
ncbi:Quinol monooxygenase YgiN [Actinokineospora alba]|uniref:Quinol monooxygenase YgiN n=1 Tax=Actinokineospora alba TaxID=504798 RepID=A0A1H0HA68_9PSEU|nr:antibiotic biosynthesis monooxygenase [Actinokineospora alba]TDP64966.1 quinol monooxygenase YgiN [Actinokineospora alba]SDH50500.1 Quinol monooxygenase YgiN [Actinokineospora alba]SDO16096.1 Quinol monooxygenase YgiN [Actinokineospora alba]